VYDFVEKLRADPSKLQILGDGKAQKSYLHIYDCVQALMLVCEDLRPEKDTSNRFDVYHLGMEEFIQVADSAKLIASEMRLNPEFILGQGLRGWVGDNPFVFLDVTKIKNLGWSPTHTIKGSIQETARWLCDNSWIFEERK